ncbi:MAG: hypothetical protein QM762_14780 [Chryseolinea sp.]
MSEANAQTYSQYVHKADSCFKIGEYDNSLKFYHQAFGIKSTEPRDLYNAACAASLGGSSHFAMALVKMAVDNGWTNISHLESDADLRSLHSLPEWTVVINDLKQKIEAIESHYDKPLQAELEALYDADQMPRRELGYFKSIVPEQKVKTDSLKQVIRRTDSLNVIKVSKIVDKHGWVGSDLVGDKASFAIYVVMQRADTKTQVKYHPLLKEAVDRKTIPAMYLAFLDDRIAVGEGRGQIYGSLLGYNEQTKKYYAYPVKDPEDVDKRRESVGLGPMSEYASMNGFKWDPKEQKDRSADVK